jgi:hypothetical protein
MSAPLILAIQPDRRQASHLASIAKRISAELLLTESAAKAVAVLGERLPDLILTPPLLSHRDEKAIAERLHEFGDAGAHIQTLTIPIFETTQAPASKGGVLSSLRKSKRKGKASSAETAGSTADSFAEQVSIYLTRAIEARQALRTRKPAAPARPASAELPPPPEQPAPIAEESAASQAQPDPARSQSEASARWEADRHTADTLPTIEELSARTPAVPEPDRSVETRIATISTSVPVVDLTPAPAAPADTRIETVSTLVPVMSRTVPDAPAPVPKPARTLVARLAMELRAADLASSAEQAVPALPALSAASAEARLDVAAMAVDAATSAPPALPTPDATPHAALHVDLSSMPLEEAASESAALPVPQAPALASVGVDLASMPLDEARSESAAAPMPEATPLATTPVDLPSVMSVAEAASGPVSVPMPDATPLASLRVNLRATDIEGSGLAVMPALPPETIDTGVDAVAAMAPLVNVAADVYPVPAVASMPHVTQLSMELPSLPAPELHDAAALVSSPPVASVDMNVAALVAVGSGEDTSARVVPIPDPTRQVAALAMTISPVDVAPRHVAIPRAPEAAAAEMSMQILAGIVPPASGDAELALPSPEAIAPPGVGMPLLPNDMAASSGQLLAVPEPVAHPSERMTETLASIVPLARSDGHNAPVPMPTLVPYVAELPMHLPPMGIPGASERILVVPAPPATVARTNIEAVAPLKTDARAYTDAAEAPPAPPSAVLPVRKKTKKQLSLKDRKAARKANRARSDRLDDSSLFNPDECRFAALVAKLDEVALDESRVSDGAPAAHTSKRKASSKRR